MIHSPRPPTRKKLKSKKQENKLLGSEHLERDEERHSRRMKRRAPSPPRKLDTVQQKHLETSEERKSLTQGKLVS
jgi:hypothetical protein